MIADKFKTYITEFLDSTYQVKDDKIFDGDNEMSAFDLAVFVQHTFAIDLDTSHFILTNWLYQYGYKDILYNLTHEEDEDGEYEMMEGEYEVMEGEYEEEDVCDYDDDALY